MTSRSIYTAGISGAVLAATAEGSMIHRLMTRSAETFGFTPAHSLAALGALACVVLALRTSRRD